LSPQSNREQIGQEDFPPVREEQDRSLWGWVFFSGFLHAALVSLLLFSFSLVVHRTVNYPVYTVDLVGGDKIGRPTAGTEIATARTLKEDKPAKPETPPKARVETESKAVVTKARTLPKAETVTKAEKEPKPEKAAPKSASKELPGDVRDKLIQAALDRIKQRASESGSRESGAVQETQERKKTDSARKEEASSGSAEQGTGASALGEGGKGGGIERSIEFVAYHNKMLRLIKENWTWIGRRFDLEVMVRFGIGENGEVFGLRVVQPSGDASFDNSVVRAVRKVNLGPPPESYRSEFRDVELVFRPKDLRG
jgi:colicin import membrane protein